MSNLIEWKFKLDDSTVVSYNKKKQDYVKMGLSTGTSSRLNTNGDLIFEVENQQSFLYLPDSFLYCEFSLYKDDTFKTPLPITDEITLEHNFFPKLFDQMRLEVGAQNVETMSNEPGTIDTMLRFVTTSNEDKVGAQYKGWVPDTGSGNFVSTIEKKGGTGTDEAKTTKAEYDAIVRRLNLDTKNTGYSKRKKMYSDSSNKYEVRWGLSPLFGYMDYEKISYQLKYKLILHRIINDKAIFFGATGTQAYLKIDKLEFWIPQITPSLEIETMVTKRLNNDKPIPVNFLKRISETYNFNSNFASWHFTRVSTSPRYLFLAFQPAIPPSFEENNSLFFLKGKYIVTSTSGGTTTKTSVKDEIESLQVLINQTRYPIDPLQINVSSENIYLEGYNSYVEMCEKFGTNPQLSAVEWRDLYPVFCFDLSSQPEDIANNGCDITIKMKKNNSNSMLKAHAVLLVETENKIEVNNGRMVRIY